MLLTQEEKSESKWFRKLNDPSGTITEIYMYRRHTDYMDVSLLYYLLCVPRHTLNESHPNQNNKITAALKLCKIKDDISECVCCGHTEESRAAHSVSQSRTRMKSFLPSLLCSWRPGRIQSTRSPSHQAHSWLKAKPGISASQWTDWETRERGRLGCSQSPSLWLKHELHS